MIVIFISFCAVMIILLSTFIQPQLPKQAQRGRWVLFAAALSIAVAWFLHNLWLSLLGTIVALTGCSFIFQELQQWLGKKIRQYSRREVQSLVMWTAWLLLLSLTIAHSIVLWRFSV